MSARRTWAIAIHGGAGVIRRDILDPAQDSAYRGALRRAIDAGIAILTAEGSALDAVVASVRVLENESLFNAGRGAVFTSEGRVELDASIMDGASLGAGAVAGVTTVRNPISLARRVMTHSPHVMLIGSGAERFAAEQGLEQVDPSWFFSVRRWRSLETYLRASKLPIPPRPAALDGSDPIEQLVHDEGKKGTVGAVARDVHGNLAAATSTGGITGKRWGRVGDSAIIGAGTYASNAACAVSATGDGEVFIRAAAAREIASLVEHRGMSIQEAADIVIHQRIAALKGEGGVIVVGRDGSGAWSFNSDGMYRARATSEGGVEVALYKDED